MRRRKFLSLAAAGTFAGLTRTHAAVQEPALSMVLTGGRYYDGSKWVTGPVGISRDGKQLLLQSVPDGAATTDVGGKIISPGFIDILADNAANPARTYRIFEKYKVSDGVTTALQMHGGSERAAAYYAQFSNLPHHINFGVSVFVMRIRNAYPNMSDRLRVVEQGLEAGALGVSHSIEYQPTPYPEVVRYAQLAKKYDRPFFLHLRYSSEQQELEGVDEAIRIARETGVRLHIDHLHSTGGTFHMAEALQKIRTAIGSGLDITCCVYPYSFWATYLHSKRFDEQWRERYGLDYNDLRLVGTGERLTAASFARYRNEMRLVAVPEGTMPMENTIDLALKESFCMIGSDGGIESEPRANSHPRGAGCFATAIRHGLDIGMKPEEILSKVTSLPASVISPAMKGRGIMGNGNVADLVVFDPATINGKASVENPNQFSAGISMVIVNGKIAYRDGVLVEAAGKPIRYSS
ncbi:MAG: amidohydrolase family protein [Bacteroidota bacterium]